MVYIENSFGELFLGKSEKWFIFIDNVWALGASLFSFNKQRSEVSKSSNEKGISWVKNGIFLRNQDDNQN